MINAVSQQFSKFVSFAEEQQAKGKKTAIASMSDVIARGGTTLEERGITITDKTDWVGMVLIRGADTQAVNNEVRALFKKTIIQMFGGEQNIPESVKAAMLLKDYGCGKPLTARRIIAVRNAIAALDRVNCFDSTIDKSGALAKKAIAVGYTRLDFGRLNTAANLLAAAKGLSYQEAMEQVMDEGSAANFAMKAGSLYMKSADAFGRGVDLHSRVASDDVRNQEIADKNGSEESAGNLREIADNLAYKFGNILNDAEKLLVAAKLPNETLANLRTEVSAVAGKFAEISDDIKSGALKTREEIRNRLFCVPMNKISDEVQNIFEELRDVAGQNPAIEEFGRYIAEHFKKSGVTYDRLCATYKHAIARDMTKSAETKFLAAAAEAGLKTGREVSIPKTIVDGLYSFFDVDPFTRKRQFDKFCANLENYGDANLRFSDAQKAILKELVEKTFGSGPKAEKVFRRLVERFEETFIAEQMLAPTDFGKYPPASQEVIVNHFKAHPEVLLAFDPGFKLDTKKEIDTVKRTIKEMMIADLNARLNEPDTKKMTSLSSGLMPLAVREYNPGYVTFNGEQIPNAELGTTFPQFAADSNIPSRKGYAEFLERKFDANHKKMRQMVSFTCGMAHGLAGAIDNDMLDAGGDKNYIKGLPFAEHRENLTIVTPAGRLPQENYNIEIDDHGDVKITFTHFIRTQLHNIIGKDAVLNPRTLREQPEEAPILGTTKIVVTMSIKGATDEDLGEGMPEFTIDDITQEELD